MMNPGVRHSRRRLPPARASPSAPTDGAAIHSFSDASPSASLPAVDPLLSAAPAPAFSHFPAASPGHAFAPSSTPGPGLACAQICFKYNFRAEIVPGNARARVRLSPPLPGSTYMHTRNLAARALGTHVFMFVLLTYIFPRSIYFTEYEYLTAVCHF